MGGLLAGRRKASGVTRIFWWRITFNHTLHAVIIQIFAGAIAAIGQLAGDFGVEAASSLGEDDWHGIHQGPGKRGRLARLAEPFQQRREAIGDPVQALHVGTVPRQPWKPTAPITPSMPVDVLDLPLLFKGDSE